MRDDSAETSFIASTRQAWLTCAAMAAWTTIAIAGIAGCRDGGSGLKRNVGLNTSTREDVFSAAVATLNTQVEFDSYRAVVQAVKHLNSWAAQQPPVPDWGPDPLLATLPPELANLDALDKLNAMEFPQSDAEQFRQLYWLRAVARSAGGHESTLAAPTSDGDVATYASEATASRRPRSLAWAENLLDWKAFIEGKPQAVRDDLNLAMRLFDWTVCHIQLDPSAKGEKEVPLVRLPWHTLLLGHGQAIDRAWLFCLVARQKGLETVVLALPGEEGQPPRPWAVSALIDHQLYLFDFKLGLPIPGPGGRGVATLEQVANDDRLLRKMDLDAEHPYPATSARAGQVVALIEASPNYLSRRMAAMQAKVVGDQKFVFFKPAAPLAARLKQLPHVADAQLWTLPYERLAEQAAAKTRLDRFGLTAGSVEMRPFRLFVLKVSGERAENEKRHEEQADRQFKEANVNQNAGRQTAAVRALWRGRVTHMLGRVSGEGGAPHAYLDVRDSVFDRDLQLRQFGFIVEKLPEGARKVLDQWQISYVQGLTDEQKSDLGAFFKAQQQRASMPNPYPDLIRYLDDRELERLDNVLERLDLAGLPPEVNPAEARQLIDVIVNLAGRQYDDYALQAKMHASFWMGIAAYDGERYKVAIDWLDKLTLQAYPDGVRTPGALYNLGRAFEGLGQTDRAIEFFEADKKSPQSAGNRLRARWLAEKNPSG